MPRLKKGQPRYKEGKIEKIISETEFKYFLDKAIQYRKQRYEQHQQDFRFKDVSIEGLLTILYYTGLRVTEIVGDPPHKYRTLSKGLKVSKRLHGIRQQDLEVVGDYLLVDVKEIRKHGQRQEPLWIPVNKLGVDMVVEAWKEAKNPEDRVFPISRVTAWRFIKEVAGNRYPHFFRLNRATNFAKDPRTSVFDLKKWFGWVDARTIEKYMGKAGRTTRKMAERL